MRTHLDELLRALKCKILGHVRDYSAPEAFKRPGECWCVRCRRYQPAGGPVDVRHLRILLRAGWTHEEIERLPNMCQVTTTETLKFLASLRQVGLTPEGLRLIESYEDGFVAGFYERFKP